MLRNQNIICFSSAGWEGHHRTSKQYLMEIFARENRVLYVETVGSRSPGLNKMHLFKIFTRLARWLKGPIKAPGIEGAHELYIYSPIVLPFHEIAWVQRFNKWLMKMTFKRLIKKLGLENPILWFYVPTASYVMGHLDEKLIVYHCVDKWSTYPGFRGSEFERMEKDLIQAADYVFTTNQLLLEEQREHTKNIHYVPHGVNSEDYDRVFNETFERPSDLESMNKTLVGMIGAISNWVDWEPIKHLAEKHPEYDILLIGPIGYDAELEPIKAIKNVHILGKRDYADLPKYYQQISCFVVSFKPTEHIKYCCPTRLYEHLAGGKPVVSTDFPAARAIGEDYVSIATTPDEFINKVEQAIAKDSPEKVEKRRAKARENSWKSRAEMMSELLMKKLKGAN